MRRFWYCRTRLSSSMEVWREASRVGRYRVEDRITTALLALGKCTLSRIADTIQLPLDEVERLAGTIGHKKISFSILDALFEIVNDSFIMEMIVATN